MRTMDTDTGHIAERGCAGAAAAPQAGGCALSGAGASAPVGPEQAPFDVVLLPTHEQAAAYRRSAAGAGGGQALFGVTVGTFSAWAADLWELYGDGRSIVTAVQRDMLMRAACERVRAEGCAPDAALAAGLARVAVRCVREASGTAELEGALSRARRGEAACEGIAAAEADVLRAVVRYGDALVAAGLVEAGEALAQLPHLMPARPMRVLLDGFPPLTLQQRRFFEACPFMQVQVRYAAGGDGPTRAPEGVRVRFEFPAGRYAWPALLADIVKDARTHGPVVVACRDPRAVYEAVSPALAREGAACAVQARVRFAETDFGRAFLPLCRFLAEGEGEGAAPFDAPGGGEAPRASAQVWNRADLADYLLSSFSGAPRGFAFDLDARVRGDRTASREDVASLLREGGGMFDVLEELAADPEANIVAGAVEDAVRRMVGRSEAWRREQLGALSVLREVTEAARMAGLGMDMCIEQLGRVQVDVSRAVRGDGGELACALPIGRSGGPDVLITDQASAAALEPGCCGALVLADMTSAAYPVSDAQDASTGLLAKLGIAPADTALARMRRAFYALERLPRSLLVVERCLNDEAAEPTYPAAVLEEFVDCYRDDPSAADDIDNPYALPPALQEGLLVRGEDLLYANASRTPVAQPLAAAVDAPCTGVVSPERRGIVVLPRVLAGGAVLREPCLSPSQIESYLECPYKWFAQRRLRLDDIDEGFGPLEMGDFAHSALRSFYTHFREDTGLGKVTPASLGQARAVMADVLARHEAYQPHLKRTENRLIAASELERREVAELKARLLGYLDFEAALLPGFHPEHLEYDVAQGGAADYAGCKLVGTADRIDVDGEGRAVIIDYKGSLAGSYALAKRGEGGLGKVQALIYAQVIRRRLGLVPVGALYVCYGRHRAASGAFDARALETAHLPGMRHAECSWAPREGSGPPAGLGGLLDETEERVAAALEGLLAGNVEPRPATDGACAWCPVASCPERRM